MRILLPLLLLVLFILSSCSPNIYTDRTQFVKDGERLPEVQLDRYKSVQLRPMQDSSMAVAMSISGGGSRAANLGIGIMLGLEAIQLPNGRNVLQEIDYLSTVSGGGFAGGAYINALYEHKRMKVDTLFSLRYYVNQHIRKDLKHSYVKALIGAIFNPKLWFTYLDDGDALERTIDDRVLGYKRRKKAWKGKGPVPSILLNDLFVDRDSLQQAVNFPMMVANASTLDKMGIFPFTPCILEQYQICGYSHRVKNYRKCKEGFSTFQMPLSVGIKASGSFPALISNTTLKSTYHPKRRFLHVIDGAMTDNFGYKTAVDILRQDAAVHKKVLLVVDADNAGNIATFSKKQTARLSFKVYGRLASSGLEARRNTLQVDLDDLGKRLDFTPIVFGFSELLRDNNSAPPPIIVRVEQQKRLIGLLQQEIDSGKAVLTDYDMQILYELVTNIGTKYTITQEEQDLLLLVGQKIVRMRKGDILKALQE